MLLEMRNISKSFGPVEALNRVDLDLDHSEVLGLVGDNAAGKSTLMKILTGVYERDEGQIFVEGNKVEISSPRDARDLGIWMVYQDLAIVEDLDVTENMFLGREIQKRLLGIRYRAIGEMRNRARHILESLGSSIQDEKRKVKFLSGGQRAEVAIGRTLVEKPIIIVMDEPTAPLSVEAAKRVLALIRDLKKGGCSIILISHRLDDVIEVSDRIMVLWRGRRIVCKEKEKLSKGQVVHYMMGVESADTSSN